MEVIFSSQKRWEQSPVDFFLNRLPFQHFPTNLLCPALAGTCTVSWLWHAQRITEMWLSQLVPWMSAIAPFKSQLRYKKKKQIQEKDKYKIIQTNWKSKMLRNWEISGTPFASSARTWSSQVALGARRWSSDLWEDLRRSFPRWEKESEVSVKYLKLRKWKKSTWTISWYWTWYNLCGIAWGIAWSIPVAWSIASCISEVTYKMCSWWAPVVCWCLNLSHIQVSNWNIGIGMALSRFICFPLLPRVRVLLKR